MTRENARDGGIPILSRGPRWATALLVLASSLLAAAALIGAYEVFQRYRYSEWRAEFSDEGEWHGQLVIPSDNPVLMWEYRPNGRFRDAERGYAIETNRYGFRERDFATPERPDGVFRVAFVGDSVTLGLYVKNSRTFVREFERRARAEVSGLNVQALNFGVDGYNTAQIRELLATRVLPFDPDQVVYVMSLNDFDFEDASGEKIRFFRPPPSFFLDSLRRLYRVLSNVEYHRYHYERNREEVFRHVVAMRDLLTARHAGFTVVLVPVFAWSEKKFDDYPLAAMHGEITGFLGGEDVAAIDLLAAFAAADPPPRAFFQDAWHPSPRGHHFIAERLLAPVLDGAMAKRR
ncbi:MAG: SGNH/GDSL hydrolase family protein [Myxococcales bacterium]|nr:SGNH/GDSL hydrolase family protein [Myxococcales bacterium]